MAKRKPPRKAKSSATTRKARPAKRAPAKAKQPRTPAKASARTPATRTAATRTPATRTPATRKPATRKPARPVARKPARKRPATVPQIDLRAGAQALGRELAGVVATEVEAEAALEAGELARAIAIYTRLIDASTAPIASHLIARGRAHYRAGDHERAIADFTAGLALEPHYPDLYFDKGKAELQAGRVAEAEASFSHDIELDPSPISFYNRHLARKALGDDAGALADLDDAIRELPDEPALRVARAILRHTLDDHAGAFADAEVAARLEPDQLAHHDLCGRFALLSGDDASAADAFAIALALADAAGTPPNPKHLEGRALALGGLGRVAEAIPLLDRALALVPGDPTFLCNRGWLLHLVERDAEALADLDRALAADGSYAQALRNRAAIHAALGDRNRALADYRALAGLGHDVSDAIARLAAR